MQLDFNYLFSLCFFAVAEMLCRTDLSGAPSTFKFSFFDPFVMNVTEEMLLTERMTKTSTCQNLN